MHLRETGQDPETGAAIDTTKAMNHKRLNAAMEFVSNDEVFDAREGEIMLYDKKEGGFPTHRRGCLFSSLNGYKVSGADKTPSSGDAAAYNARCEKANPRAALHDSDMRFVGLCQNSFVSSNTALAEQGMAVQVSGIKTIINDSEETISIGDKLMVDTMQRPPSKVRKGIPNEKVRCVLRKVPPGYVPQKAMNAAVDKIIDAMKEGAYDEKKYGAKIVDATGALEEDDQKAALKNIVALAILELRKAGQWVVGVAENSARHGEQLDVLLTKPSFL